MKEAFKKIIIRGPYTAIYGNSFKYIKGIAAGSIGAIITDPPFGQQHLLKSLYGRRELGHRTIKNDTSLFWLEDFARECYRVLPSKGWAVFFWQWRTIFEPIKAMKAAGFELKTVGVWNKKNGGLGTGLTEAYENILFFRKGKARENYLRPNVFTKFRGLGRPLHPHQKPAELFGELIRLLTKPGDLVCDFFAGSFANGEAAIKNGRRFRGVELDNTPENLYFDKGAGRLLRVYQKAQKKLKFKQTFERPGVQKIAF